MENHSTAQDHSTAQINLVSKESIRKFVKEEILNDPSINMHFVPDGLEGAVYEKLITKLVNILNKTLESVRVDILGHRMTMNFYPIPE